MKVFHYHWLAHTACEQAFERGNRNECDDTAQEEKKKLNKYSQCKVSCVLACLPPLHFIFGR